MKWKVEQLARIEARQMIQQTLDKPSERSELSEQHEKNEDEE